MKPLTLSAKVGTVVVVLGLALALFLNIFMKPVYGHCRNTAEGYTCDLLRWEWK